MYLCMSQMFILFTVCSKEIHKRAYTFILRIYSMFVGENTIDLNFNRFIGSIRISIRSVRPFLFHLLSISEIIQIHR